MTAAETLAQVLANLPSPLTVAELAEKTGIKSATVERTLRKLDAEGVAERVGKNDNGVTVWGAMSDGTAPEPEHEGGFEGTADEVESTEPVCGISYDHKLKLVGERDGITSYTCGECDAEVVEESEPADDPRPVSPARAEIDNVLAQIDPNGDAQRDHEPAAPATRTATGRHPKGYLAGLIKTHLAAHPGEQFTPYQLGVALGMKGNGGINYATEQLAKKDEIAQPSDKPVRYQDKTAFEGAGAADNDSE